MSEQLLMNMKQQQILQKNTSLKQYKDEDMVDLQKHIFPSDITEQTQMMIDLNSQSNKQKFILQKEVETVPTQNLVSYSIMDQSKEVDPKDENQVTQVHEKKIKTLESNAKFFEAQAHPLFIENSQLKDQLIELNEQVRERTKDFAQLVKDVNHKGEARDLIKRIGDLEQIYLVLKDDINYYCGTLEKLTFDKQNLEATVKRLQSNLNDQDSQFKLEIEELKKSYFDQIQQLREKLNSLQKTIGCLEKDLAAEKADKQHMIEKKDAEIRNMQTLLSDQRERAKKQEIEFQKQLQALEQIVQQNKEKYFKEKKEITDKFEDLLAKQKLGYEIQIQKLKDEAEAKQRMLQEQINQKNDYIAALESDYKKLKYNTDKEIARLNIELDQANNTLKQQKEFISNLQQTIQQLKQNIQEHENTIQNKTEQINKLTTDLQTLDDEYRRYKVEAESEILKLQQKIQQLQFDLKSTIEEWKKKLEDLVIENEVKMREEITKLTDKYEAQLKQTKEELEKALELLEKEKGELIISLQIQIEQLKLERDKLQRQLVQDNEDWQTKYNQMEESLNQKCQNLEAHYQGVVDQLNKKLQQELQEAEENRKKQFQELEQLRITQLAQLKQQEQDRYNSMEQSLTKKYNDCNESWQIRYNELEQKMKQKVESLEQLLKQQFVELEKKRAKEVADIKSFYEEEIKRLKLKLEGSTKGMIEEIKDQHRKEIEKMKQIYEDKLKSLQMEWETKYNLKLEELNNKIQSLIQQYESEKLSHEKLKQLFAEMRDKLEKEIAELKAKNTEQKLYYEKVIQELNETYKKKIDQMQEQIDQLQKEIQTLIQNHQEEIKKLQDEINKLKQQLSELEGQLRAKFEAEINKLLQEHLEFVENMKREFSSLQEAHQHKMEQYIQEHKSLEKMFGERPSRPDDIRYIKNMLKEIDQYKQNLQEADMKVGHANEIVKYLQLELENYKNIYDIFGPNKQKIPSEALDQLNMQHIKQINSDLMSQSPLMAGQQQQHPVQFFQQLQQEKPQVQQLQQQQPQFSSLQQQQQQQQQQQLNSSQIAQQKLQMQQQLKNIIFSKQGNSNIPNNRKINIKLEQSAQVESPLKKNREYSKNKQVLTSAEQDNGENQSASKIQKMQEIKKDSKEQKELNQLKEIRDAKEQREILKEQKKLLLGDKDVATNMEEVLDVLTDQKVEKQKQLITLSPLKVSGRKRLNSVQNKKRTNSTLQKYDSVSDIEQENSESQNKSYFQVNTQIYQSQANYNDEKSNNGGCQTNLLGKLKISPDKITTDKIAVGTLQRRQVQQGNDGTASGNDSLIINNKYQKYQKSLTNNIAQFVQQNQSLLY